MNDPCPAAALFKVILTTCFNFFEDHVTVSVLNGNVDNRFCVNTDLWTQYITHPWTLAAHLYCSAYNSALHPFLVAKLSTSFGWGMGGNVTSAR